MHSQNNCTVMYTYDFNLEILFYTTETAANLDLKYTDSRLGYCNKFRYCPFCGKKINWKLIKQFQMKNSNGNK